MIGSHSSNMAPAWRGFRYGFQFRRQFNYDSAPHGGATGNTAYFKTLSINHAAIIDGEQNLAHTATVPTKA
jgi:hypothetical protein